MQTLDVIAGLTVHTDQHEQATTCLRGMLCFIATSRAARNSVPHVVPPRFVHRIPVWGILRRNARDVPHGIEGAEEYCHLMSGYGFIPGGAAKTPPRWENGLWHCSVSSHRMATLAPEDFDLGAARQGIFARGRV